MHSCIWLGITWSSTPSLDILKKQFIKWLGSLMTCWVPQMRIIYSVLPLLPSCKHKKYILADWPQNQQLCRICFTVLIQKSLPVSTCMNQIGQCFKLLFLASFSRDVIKWSWSNIVSKYCLIISPLLACYKWLFFPTWWIPIKNKEIQDLKSTLLHCEQPLFGTLKALYRVTLKFLSKIDSNVISACLMTFTC